MRKINNVVPLLVLLISLSCTRHTRRDTVAITTNLSEKLYVEKRYFYIGEIPKAEIDSIEFKFILKNLSDSSIKVNRIDVSCSCLKINTSVREILPKDSISLEGKAGLQKQYGHISKSIFVNYDEDKILLLRVIGDIK